MMLELGIGDAYGACFECTPKTFVDRNNDLHYEIHPRILRRYPTDKQPTLVPSGHYTDDTQMSIAIAEIMLDPEFDWGNDEALADKFLEVFKRDERRGYTPFLFLTLLNSSSGKELISKIHGTSNKSGGFMRAAPIGMYPTLEETMEKAALQAMLTHDSWVGRNSAIGAAMMTHYFYHDLGPKAELVQWLKDQHFRHTLRSDKPFDAFGDTVEPWTPDKRVRVHGWDCFEAALYAIEESDSLSEVLFKCVAFTGDVDTVAAVAMATASCSKEIEKDIPQNLVEEFEDGPFGHDFLIDLDGQLKEAFPCVGR